MEQLEESRRKNRRSDSAETFRSGVSILKKRGVRLGVEQWTVREQVFLAALDLSELSVCESMLQELEAAFPGSQRVKRLRGLLLEAQGKTKEAASVYDEMIKENEVNSVGLKRKICLLKSAGKLQEAIQQLSLYLDVFQADAEAWKELARLYVEAGSFKSASFCLEEVILSAPHSYLSHLAYAEALYTLGSPVSNLRESRSYFCLSLSKKSNSTRALLGLLVTTKALNSYYTTLSDKTADKEDSDNNKAINKKAIQRLASAPLAPGMDEILQAALKRLSLSTA